MVGFEALKLKRLSGFAGYAVAAVRTIAVFDRAPDAGLLKGPGNYHDEDIGKPFIAVVNSFVEIIPGHAHLDKVGYFIKDAVRQAGGVPFIFNTIGIDDGIAQQDIALVLRTSGATVPAAAFGLAGGAGRSRDRPQQGAGHQFPDRVVHRHEVR